MKLYLDDDSVDGLLIKLLKAEGHDVFVPPETGRRTVNDQVHLLNAILENRMVLTHNHFDFTELDELVVKSGGHHPGILIAWKDNDRRDMKPHEIVASLSRLLGFASPLSDKCHTLNAYRSR